MKYQVWKTGVVLTDNVSLCSLVGAAEIKIKVSLPEMYVNKLYVLNRVCQRLYNFFLICLSTQSDSSNILSFRLI